MTSFELWRIIHRYDKIIQKEYKQKIKDVRETFKNSHFLASKDSLSQDFAGKGIYGNYTLKELFGTDDLRLIKDALHKHFKRCKLTLIEDLSFSYAPFGEAKENCWYIGYGKVFFQKAYQYARVGYMVGRS